jgi:sugar/nucleoside kinase (ribokinase family)
MAGIAWDVLGIGENSVDETLRLGSQPRTTDASAGAHATKAQILSRTRWPGGQVATTLSTCAALGLRTAYAGVFGHDENGRFVRHEMERCGIDTSCAVVRPVPNRCATILVPPDGERVVLWQRDPGLALSPGDVPLDVLARARVVHIDTVDEEAALWTARAACAAGVLVTSDIDVVTERTFALIGAVTVAIVGEHVPEALTGESGLERALRRLSGQLRRPSPLLCVTLGKRGAALLHDDCYAEVPGVPVDAVDTTGAGDVFRGAFIFAWLRGDGPVEVLTFANTVAALSCTRPGAMPSVPSLADVRAALGA